MGGNRSKERDRKSELVLRSTYQIFEWDRNNSDRIFYNHMAMPQCRYLAKGAKRPSHTTNTMKFDRIPFDPCNSIKRFDLCPFDQKNSAYLQPPNGQICSHTPSALNAGAKRRGATCHMAMPQCCYLAKGAKRPSHTTKMLTSSNISVN